MFFQLFLFLLLPDWRPSSIPKPQPQAGHHEYGIRISIPTRAPPICSFSSHHPVCQDTLLFLKRAGTNPSPWAPNMWKMGGGEGRGVWGRGEVQFLQRMGSGSVQGLIKRLGLISRVFQESSRGERRGGLGLLKQPANFVLQLHTGARLQGAVCFGQMCYTETVVGQCWGSGGDWGRGGPVHLRQGEEFSFRWCQTSGCLEEPAVTWAQDAGQWGHVRCWGGAWRAEQLYLQCRSGQCAERE